MHTVAIAIQTGSCWFNWWRMETPASVITVRITPMMNLAVRVLVIGISRF